MSLVGNRIKEARINKGWSQEELASKIGTTKATISRYEKGLREPRLDTLRALADKNVLDVSVGYLQGYESKDTKKIVEALEKSDMRSVENLMGLPKGSILPLSDEDRAEIEGQLQKNRHNAESATRQNSNLIEVNVTPDPEWIYLYNKLKDGSITPEELQRFDSMNHESFENSRKLIEIAKVRLNFYMGILNEAGFLKAIERIEELTEIPKYRKEKNPSEDE